MPQQVEFEAKGLSDMVMSEPPPERAESSTDGEKCNENVKRGKECLIKSMVSNHLFSSQLCVKMVN